MFLPKITKRKICIFVSLLLVLHLVCGQTSQLRNVITEHNEEQKTWTEAQTLCRQENLDLITIQNEEQNNQLIELSYQGWIGLYRVNKTQPWRWSRTRELATFLNWYPGEPNNLENEFCAVMKSSGEWNNLKCEVKRDYICHRENLMLVREEKTWEEALIFCRSLGMDPESNKPLYDLATLISEDDHNYARERAQDATTDEVWTGLCFLGDQWHWIGGQDVQYGDIPSCPDFACGVLEKKHSVSFGIRRCSEKKNFFCHKTP